MASDGSTERRLGDSPVCRRCRFPMKLTGIEPHPQYANLKNEIYECQACGEKKIVAVRFA